MAEASFVLPPPDPLVVRPWGPDVAAAFVAAAGRARERMPTYSSLETALQRKQYKSHMATFALVPKIPLQCIARSMSISEADLRPCGPDAVLFSVVGAMSRAPAASIDRARTSLARWTKFATTDGRPPLGPGIFAPLDVQAFLMQVHRDAAARSKHPLQQGATAAPNVRQGLTFELLAVPTAILSFSALMANRSVFFFVDSTTAMGALVHGTSSADALAALARYTHVLMANEVPDYWFEWISTRTNPADGPSRGILPATATQVAPIFPLASTIFSTQATLALLK